MGVVEKAIPIGGGGSYSRVIFTYVDNTKVTADLSKYFSEWNSLTADDISIDLGTSNLLRPNMLDAYQVVFNKSYDNTTGILTIQSNRNGLFYTTYLPLSATVYVNKNCKSIFTPHHNNSFVWRANRLATGINLENTGKIKFEVLSKGTPAVTSITIFGTDDPNHIYNSGPILGTFIPNYVGKIEEFELEKNFSRLVLWSIYDNDNSWWANVKITT